MEKGIVGEVIGCNQAIAKAIDSIIMHLYFANDFIQRIHANHLFKSISREVDDGEGATISIARIRALYSDIGFVAADGDALSR